MIDPGWLTRAGFLVGATTMAGCAGSMNIQPLDVPRLHQELAADPDNPNLLTRYAVGLFAAEDCVRASAAARSAIALAPANGVALLVVGECLERDGKHDQALTAYQAYLASYASERDAAAVGARAELAGRLRAQTLARAAIQNEPPAHPENAEVTGVLPLVIVGDSALSPLSMGLAYMITTDLALLQRFRVVERLEMEALASELALSTSERVDPEAALRVGRLSGAGRLLQGTLVGQPDEVASLSASVALSNGDVVETVAPDGTLKDLLRLEKQLVLGLAEDLGYVLTDADRQRILENGPRNLAAFLAFSNGLLSERFGLFEDAVAHYGEAARADPRFVAARGRLRLSAAVAATQRSARGQPGEAVDNVNDAIEDEERGAGIESQLAALASSILDLAGHQSERVPLTEELINSVVDPPRGPDFTSFVADLLLRISIPGR